MRQFDLGKIVKSLEKPAFSEFSDRVLYQLCKKHPQHTDKSISAAKILIIGRTYAAAIERRKSKETDSENFYEETVAPVIVCSEIDRKLRDLDSVRKISPESIQQILDTHKYVTDLFFCISKENKRSLASKYLHFHKPNLFYVYDSRAAKGIRNLFKFTGIAKGKVNDGSDKVDNEYRKFAEKCLALQNHIKNKYKASLSPRQIDRILLSKDVQKLVAE